MTHDPAIIEAVRRQLLAANWLSPTAHLDTARAIAAVVTPMIEAATLERAARVAEDSVMTMVNKQKVATAIRALKEQP